MYTATKFAIHGAVLFHRPSFLLVYSYSTGVSMTLHDEIAPLGLRSVCIDPGHFRTSILSEINRMPWISRIADYKSMSEQVEADFDGWSPVLTSHDTN
jgi:NAD(P)-dependent dehydrogenase (short-subunit alcohol dehydrogenase family)